MIQDIDTASAVQRYPLGMRYVLDDRVFRYAKAGGTLNPDFGVKNGQYQHIAFTTIHTNALILAKTIVIDVAGTDGNNADGVIGLNELAGGYVVIYTHASYTINRRIVTNTATTGAGVMTLTIDKPLPCALTATTMHAECIASPYLLVRTIAEDDKSVVGMPTVYATINQYLWLQTWGPCWVAPSVRVSVGSNNRRVVFTIDGSLDEDNITNPLVFKAQIAGFVLANAHGGGQGAPFIFLQISP